MGNCAAARRGIAPLPGAGGSGRGRGATCSSDKRGRRPNTMLVWRYIYAVAWLLRLILARDHLVWFRGPEALHLRLAAGNLVWYHFWQLAIWFGTTPGL